MKLLAWVSAFAVLGGALFQAPARPSTATGEWPTYGGDLASTQYSPLDQIRRENFAELRIAWRAPIPRRHAQRDPAGWQRVGRRARAVFDELNRLDPKRWRDSQPPFINNFKATPLMVGGVAVPQHAAVDWRRRRCTDRCDALGVQPEKLRSRHDHA